MAGEQDNPKGVVGVMNASDGSLVASVSDFHRNGYGGFTMAEAQRVRAKRALAFATINALCHPDIARALESYDAEQLTDKLMRKLGYRATFIEIGHEKDPADGR